MMVRSSRRRLRIRLQCVRSSNRRTFCMRAQADGNGGVVSILNGVGFVRFDNCTVANIRVRALRREATRSAVHACERLALRGSAVHNCVVSVCVGVPLGSARRAHWFCRESLQMVAVARSRGVSYAGQWQRWAHGYLRHRHHRPRQRRRLDPHEHHGACALLEYPLSPRRTMAPVRLLRTADTPRSTARRVAASTRRTLPALPPRCAVLTAQRGAAG